MADQAEQSGACLERSGDLPTRAAIEAAGRAIAGHVRRTPVLDIDRAELGLTGGAAVTLKLEHLQHTGSFKARGAFNALLSEPVPPAGVIAASGGNHGAAVAYAARALGHRAEIFVPEIAHPAKRARLEAYGAKLHVVGRDFQEALDACLTRREETGARLLHAYDQPAILAGQGTVADELAVQAPDLDTLLVAVGGGGLIGGIACRYRGDVRLIAVETEGTAALHASRRAGTPTEVAVSGLAADSLGARRIGDLAFAASRSFVADSLLIDDAAVRQAQGWLWETVRQIAEPGGAVALGALLSGAYRPADGERVGVLICGANTKPADPSDPAAD
ncbi:threonine/serine dehydratase [Marivibrio halodurans]|uniref:Threonine/serine dehydratase n=1 Tax=Marivibrio halodurans TaxID=2039722 RepID=A0A8J7V142_9PROT|nr:threonine/serine dehydratase [Marivibrio halodurans]MBP5855447.1 threonine/serine dehydratase [Marivibrio halodurans]